MKILKLFQKPFVTMSREEQWKNGEDDCRTGLRQGRGGGLEDEAAWRNLVGLKKGSMSLL